MLTSDPFANPLFVPTLRVVVGLLGGILPVLLAAVRFDLRRLRANVLFHRWRVWAIIAPIYGLAVLGGPLTTALLVSILVFQALREYSALVGLPATYKKVLLTLGLLATPAALLSREVFYTLPPVMLMLATLQPLILQRENNSIRHLAFAAFGWAYVAWLLAHLVLIHRYIPGGSGILLAVGLATALSDVGAFTVGKLFGKHKLAPRLSPGKTWEGTIGNILGASLGVSLMAFALPEALLMPLLLALPLVVAVGAVWGDLLESSIKREFAAKDAGNWLPGFGGLLDRIDSLIIVVPLTYYTLVLLQWIGGRF